MSIDENEELNLGKKKRNSETNFKSPREAYEALLTKGTQRVFKQSALKQYKKIQRQAELRKKVGVFAPVAESTIEMQQQMQESQRRQGVIRSVVGKAEQFEQKIMRLNEVPMLMNMEKARGQVVSPPDRWIESVEREATRSMPD